MRIWKLRDYLWWYTIQGLMKSHCRHGHAFTKDNSYHYPKRNQLICKTCTLARQVAKRNRAKQSEVTPTAPPKVTPTPYREPEVTVNEAPAIDYSTLTFTRLLDGIKARNNVARVGGWLYVELPTYPYPTVFVANYSDYELLAPHRWRLIMDRTHNGKLVEGRIVTTMIEAGYEVPITIEAVLLNRPRKDAIPHLNENPLDVRRVNLQPSRHRETTEPNKYTVKGDDAFVHLPCGKRVTIDREDVAKVRSYRWLSTYRQNKNGDEIFYARASFRNEEGTHTHFLLQKFLLDIPNTASVRVLFTDGDRYNFRRSNLAIRKMGTYYENEPSKDHCIRGHIFDEENTRIYTDKQGRKHRVCRDCKRDILKRYQAKHRAPVTYNQRNPTEKHDE